MESGKEMLQKNNPQLYYELLELNDWCPVKLDLDELSLPNLMRLSKNLNQMYAMRTCTNCKYDYDEYEKESFECKTCVEYSYWKFNKQRLK